jgi:hypothetical protein
MTKDKLHKIFLSFLISLNSIILIIKENYKYINSKHLYFYNINLNNYFYKTFFAILATQNLENYRNIFFIKNYFLISNYPTLLYLNNH